MTEEEDDLDREMAGKKVRRELVMHHDGDGRCNRCTSGGRGAAARAASGIQRNIQFL